jgi:hypothetical protein
MVMDVRTVISLLFFLGAIGLTYMFLGSTLSIPILGEVDLLLILSISSLAGVVGLAYTVISSRE